MDRTGPTNMGVIQTNTSQQDDPPAFAVGAQRGLAPRSTRDGNGAGAVWLRLQIRWRLRDREGSHACGHVREGRRGEIYGEGREIRRHELRYSGRNLPPLQGDRVPDTPAHV